MNKIIKFAISAIAFAALVWSCSEQPNEREFTGDFGNENAQYRNAETKNLSPYAIFGDSSFVLMTEAERTGKHSLNVTNLDTEVSEFGKMEIIPKTGLVRIYHVNGNLLEQFYLPSHAIARFIGVDPIADQFPHVNPYNYAENMVPNAIDLWGLQAYRVNQENNSITISANVYYNSNNRAMNYRLNEPQYDGKSLIDLAQQGLQSSTVSIGGVDWAVSFDVKYHGVDSDQAIVDAVSADPTGSSIGLVRTSDGTNFYSDEAKTIALNSPRGDGTTLTHELGHAFGLPHSSQIAGSPYFGQGDGSTASEQSIANTSGLPIGPLMSYDNSRAFQTHEISALANHAVGVANGKNVTLTNYHSSSFTGQYGLMPQSNYQQLLIYRTPEIKAGFSKLNKY